jgi:hypothetical protein
MLSQLFAEQDSDLNMACPANTIAVLDRISMSMPLKLQEHLPGQQHAADVFLAARN